MKVNNIIDGAMIEILKLQTENEVLSAELNKLLQEKEESKDVNES